MYKYGSLAFNFHKANGRIAILPNLYASFVYFLKKFPFQRTRYVWIASAVLQPLDQHASHNNNNNN